MSASERKQKNKLHWLARGRADAVLAIGTRLSWSDDRIDATAKDLLGLDGYDMHFARQRANDCAE